MELIYVTTVVLAAFIFILGGLISYVYWQQTKMLQHIQALSLFVASLAREKEDAEAVTEAVVEDMGTKTDTEEEEEEDEDAESVSEKVDDRIEVVEGPPVDVDDIKTKTVKQLQEILTKKGIPFGKRDSRSSLIQLLNATA